MVDVALGQDLVFEERAENLTKANLLKWTVLSDAEKSIVKKLVGPGAKLLSGPRGSGKSTLLRVAFYEAARGKSAFAVYVNYAKALATEPLFHSHADAAILFRQWVLAKILLSIPEAADLWGLQLLPSDLASIQKSTEYVQTLESGAAPTGLGPGLSPSRLTEVLCELAARAGVSRTVLLLDDAAHAFSVKQQREFFEIFRELRSRDVSGKAAIYPGVTSFSPTFQVGHEAELIEAWFRPDEVNYLATMRQIAAARFPSFVPKDPLVVDALALASFGLPRGFLSLCYELQDSAASGSRAEIVDEVNVHADIVRTVFSNIADRLPRFQHFIEVGQRFERACVSALREYNGGKDIRRKSATIALSEPIDAGLQRVLRFMEYAGLVRAQEGLLSKGEKGTYKRYLLHYSLVIGGNALAIGRSYKVADVVLALARPNAHALVKTRAETLLGAGFEKDCVLALPPCPRCATSRLSEDQKFCMNCGQELRAASVYHDLLEAEVDKLPLPSRKVEALREQGFLKVGQLLSDENQSFRKPGSSIGAVWAKRITTAAEEWVSV